MSKPDLATISYNRRVWSKFNEASLGDTSIKDLQELSEHLDKTISLLAMFPETESTRMYLAFQLSSLNTIIFHRKHPL